MGRTPMRRTPNSQSSLRPFESGPSLRSLEQHLDELLAPEKSRGFLVRVLHHELGASAMLEDRIKPFLNDPADLPKVHLLATKNIVVRGESFQSDPAFQEAYAKVVLKYQHTPPIELGPNIMMKELKEGKVIRFGFLALRQLEFEESLRGLDSLPNQIVDNTPKPRIPKPNYVYFDMPSSAIKSESARRNPAVNYQQTIKDNPKSHFVIPIKIGGFNMHSNAPADRNGSKELPTAS